MLLFATDLSAYVIPGLFIVFIIGAIVYNYMKKNTYQKNADMMYKGLEEGDKVKTYAGMYGEIVSIREAVDGTKVCIIKSGDENHYSYFELDIAAVYALDEKDVEQPQEEEQVQQQEEEKVQEEEQVKEKEQPKEVAVEKQEDKVD